MDQELTVLENKTIGRNFYIARKVRDRKAAEVAEYCQMSEAAYTKYERGESKITIELIQKVAECLSVDPLHLITAAPGNIIENGHNSPIAINGYNQTMNEEQLKMTNKLIETTLTLVDKLVLLIDTKLK